MKRSKLILFSIISAAMLVPFQSCSNNYKIDTSGPGVDAAASTPVDPSNPTPNPTPVIDIPDFSCQSIQVVPLANPMVIAARDPSTGVCYAVQLFQAIPEGPSSLTTTIDDDVISRNHDISDTDSNVTHHPYLMGQETLNVTFQGVRNIKLAGSSSDDTSPILIDNFALVGFKAVASASADASALSPSDYQAYGTSDSTVNNTNGVLMNGQLVVLTPFASGGTATVNALDISQAIQANQSYVLDVRAEDCGGARALSNVYVLFK